MATMLITLLAVLGGTPSTKVAPIELETWCGSAISSSSVK